MQQFNIQFIEPGMTMELWDPHGLKKKPKP